MEMPIVSQVYVKKGSKREDYEDFVIVNEVGNGKVSFSNPFNDWFELSVESFSKQYVKGNRSDYDMFEEGQGIHIVEVNGKEYPVLTQGKDAYICLDEEGRKFRVSKDEGSLLEYGFEGYDERAERAKKYMKDHEVKFIPEKESTSILNNPDVKRDIGKILDDFIKEIIGYFGKDKTGNKLVFSTKIYPSKFVKYDKAYRGISMCNLGLTVDGRLKDMGISAIAEDKGDGKIRYKIEVHGNIGTSVPVFDKITRIPYDKALDVNTVREVFNKYKKSYKKFAEDIISSLIGDKHR